MTFPVGMPNGSAAVGRRGDADRSRLKAFEVKRPYQAKSSTIGAR
jgi:hypothetical protein